MLTNQDIPTSTMPVGASADRKGSDRSDMFRWRYFGAKPGHVSAPGDVASLLGMPLGAIPLPVQDKVAELVDEVEHLRAELNQAQHHVHWLEELSDHHPLLPVLHRRAFLRELSRVVEQSERAGLSGTLVLLHVGGVELLRSVHGLEAGDAALTHLANRLKAELRQTDLLGYLDSGDFALALTLAEDEPAEDKARKLAASLSSQPFEWQGQSFHFTLLAGQAHFRPGDTAQSLLLAADKSRRGNVSELEDEG